MSIIADAPTDLEGWVDTAEMPFAMLSTARIAESLAVHVEKLGGPSLFVTTCRDFPVKRQHLMHPLLAACVRRWCDDLPLNLFMRPYLPDFSSDAAGPADSSPPEPEDDEAASCSLFTWCDGHEQISPESDGVHMTQIQVGTFQGGQPMHAWAIRYLPVEEGDEPTHWVFSMPEGGEWSFGSDDVDRALDEGVAQLERTRAAIKAFLAENDRFDPDDDGGDLL